MDSGTNVFVWGEQGLERSRLLSLALSNINNKDIMCHYIAYCKNV